MSNGRDDLRLALGMPQHLKTRALCKSLGAEGFKALIFLWCYVGENHKDGDLSRLSDEEIEAAAEWPGEPGVFVAALRRIRWLDEKRVHDWIEEQPYIAQTDQRVAAARVGGKARAANATRDSKGRLQRLAGGAGPASPANRLIAGVQRSSPLPPSEGGEQTLVALDAPQRAEAEAEAEQTKPRVYAPIDSLSDPEWARKQREKRRRGTA